MWHAQNSLAYRRKLSLSRDKTVALWEWQKSDSPSLVHTGLIDRAAVSHDGERIYSVSYDGSLRVWDRSTGTQADAFGQGSAVRSVAVSMDDQKVRIGVQNGRVKVLDCRTGDALFEEKHMRGECQVLHSVRAGVNLLQADGTKIFAYGIRRRGLDWLAGWRTWSFCEMRCVQSQWTATCIVFR